MKILSPEEAERKCEILIIECNCGFHLGLDESYLDQVGHIKINCPSCKALVDTKILLKEI